MCSSDHPLAQGMRRHQMCCVDQPDHDRGQCGGDFALDGAQARKRFRRSFRRFFKFHDQIFDHGRLDAGMADETEAIVAHLKKQRLIAGADRQGLGAARQNRAVSHVNGYRKNLRQMPVERVGDDTAGMVEHKAQLRLLCSATRRAREDAGPIPMPMTGKPRSR